MSRHTVSPGGFGSCIKTLEKCETDSMARLPMEGNPDAKPLRAVHADVRKSYITAVAKDSVYILSTLPTDGGLGSPSTGSAHTQC